jgi:hypothetical protein
MSADVLAASGPRPIGRAVWPHAANAVLGLWLASAPATFGPHDPALLWSEVVSGVLVVVLSALACTERFRWAAWAAAAVGLWLMAAPLVFWAPTAAAYAVDTVAGTLVVAFAVLVPGTVGTRDFPGPDAPPGWSYNPSAWSQRAGIIALALVQFFIARHLAAYQLRHIAAPWDPFFGDGTRRVLDSDVSKAFPVSDAGLGAYTYLLEALAGFLGGTRRWRTMPWAVVLFGVLVVPVGVVSIVLVVLQPLAVGAWCSLCLVTALLTVFMIAPAVDEVLATVQFLRRSRREGRFWRTFWRGGGEPVTEEPPRRAGSLPHELAGGMELTTVPWNLALCAAVGVWLMVSPGVLGYSGNAAGNVILVGALVATFAVIGFGESARAARLVNVALGLWLIASPVILWDDSTGLRWPDAAAGLAVVLLSIRRGLVRERFGTWDRYVV